MSKKADEIVENLPSTEKIVKGLENVKRELNSTRTAPGVDSTGQKILIDTEQVLSDTERLLLEKNEGDKVQRLLKEGKKAAEELQRHAVELKKTGASANVDVDRLRRLAERTMETARLAGIELVSSNSFRRELGDFVVLCYDILAEGTYTPGDKQGTSQGVETGKKKTKPAKGKERVKGKEKVKGKTIDEPTRIETDKPTTKKPDISTGPLVTPPPAPPPPPTTMTPTTTEGVKTEEAAPTEAIKEKATEGIEKAVEKVNVGLEAAGAPQRIHLTKEQINKLLDRFVQLMRNISKRERSRNVFLGVLDMFKLLNEQISPTAGEVAHKAEKSAEQLQYNKHVKKTFQLAKELIEQFTGANTLDALIGHLRHIRKILRKDPETRNYFDDLREYVSDMLKHPENFDDPQATKRGRHLIKRGRKLHDEKLYVHLHGVLDELNAMVKNIQQDPVTKKLRHDMKVLIQDIMLDEEGNIVLKEHALQQLRMIVVSSVIERMKIPVPVIHIEDKDMEYTLRNLVVAIRDLIPEKVILEDRGRIALDFTDVRQPEVEAASNTLRFVIEGVNIHMEQADISFNRKTFPKVTDSGKLRLDIGGRGMDLIIQLQTFTRSKQAFRVEYVDCDVHSMSFYLQDTRHDWLYNSVLKLLSGRIKRNVETSIEDTLTNHLELLNRLLTKQLRKTKVLTSKKGLKSALKSGVTNVLTSGNNISSKET